MVLQNVVISYPFNPLSTFHDQLRLGFAATKSVTIGLAGGLIDGTDSLRWFVAVGRSGIGGGPGAIWTSWQGIFQLLPFWVFAPFDLDSILIVLWEGPIFF
jgi:hypothetical protein